MKVFGGTPIAAAAWTAAMIVMVTVATVPGVAQAPAAGTAYVVTYVEVAPSTEAEAAGLLRAVAAASRKEAGNERYDVLQRIGRKNQFAILEAWTDHKAAQAHAGGAALMQFKEKLRPLEVSFYDERPSNGIAVAPAPAAVGKDAVYVVTHVDVTPPNKDACIVMLKKLADGARKERGSLRFDVWQQNNRGNHFTVTEIWTNRAAADSHIAAPGTREFREKLGPMSGALYDERRYKSL